MPIATHDVIVGVVGEETCWMLGQRMGKLRDALHQSMSLNPLLMPILYDFHGSSNFEELGELLVVGHLMSGHSTSFGKLLDEKVLPRAFKTKKLTGAFRAKLHPFAEAPFNEIDHLVSRPDGPILLSLKASRWTIQLTAAVELNRAFARILTEYPDFKRIVVGVSAGKLETLTDKYEILRGINRGKRHDVTDLTKNVEVYAGREFWSWLNGNEPATQDWILEGILAGLKKADCRNECAALLKHFTQVINEQYKDFVHKDGKVNWQALLTKING